MKYIILRSKDETTEKVIHKNDAEKLIEKGSAEWVMSSNGVRYVRMTGQNNDSI